MKSQKHEHKQSSSGDKFIEPQTGVEQFERYITKITDINLLHFAVTCVLCMLIIDILPGMVTTDQPKKN